MSRTFCLMSPTGDFLGSTFTGDNPIDAAKKAATKGHTRILLCERLSRDRYASTIHTYDGGIRTVSEDERTHFMKTHGIMRKPQVRATGKLKFGP